MTARVIPEYLPTVIGLTNAEVTQLGALSAKYFDGAWDLSNTSKLSAAEKVLVNKFKSKIKDHLFHAGQGNYCCYCGYALADHKATYDAEHCISKASRSVLVFSTRNLALSCKPCNGSKGVVRVRVFPLDDEIDAVSIGSDKYRIINPHFDKWQDHLAFDQFGRVVAVDGEGLTKGRLTIRLFKIDRKNAMALANHFDMFKASAAARKDWINFYAAAVGEDDTHRKTKYKSFLKTLLTMPSDPAADSLRALLKPVLPP